MRGEVGKKPPKKRWIIPRFCDVTWLIVSHFVPLLLKYGFTLILFKPFNQLYTKVVILFIIISYVFQFIAITLCVKILAYPKTVSGFLE